MDNSNSDIDAQMLMYSEPNNLFASPRPTQRDSKLPTHPIYKSVNERNESIKYNVFIIIISFIKFALTVTAVCFPSRLCTSLINAWMITLSGHDLLVVLTRSILISCLAKLQKKKPKSQVPSVIRPVKDREYNTTILYLQPEQPQILTESKKLFSSENKKKEFLKLLLGAFLFGYLGLFLWGQIIFFQHFHGCQGLPTFKLIVYYINVLSGYAFVGLPLLFALVSCTCFVWLHLGSCCLQKMKQSQKKQNETLDFFGSPNKAEDLKSKILDISPREKEVVLEYDYDGQMNKPGENNI